MAFKTVEELLVLPPAQVIKYLYVHTKDASFRTYIQSHPKVKELNEYVKSRPKAAPTLKEFVKVKEEVEIAKYQSLIFRVKKFFFKRYLIIKVLFSKGHYIKAIPEALFRSKRYKITDKKWGDHK